MMVAVAMIVVIMAVVVRMVAVFMIIWGFMITWVFMMGHVLKFPVCPIRSKVLWGAIHEFKSISITDLGFSHWIL